MAPKQLPQRRLRVLRYGHQQLSLGLRQRTKYLSHLLEPQAGHEPGQLLRLNNLQQRFRHGQRHTVIRLGGLKHIGQRQPVPANLDFVRKTLGPRVRRITTHQVGARHVEKLRARPLRFREPPIE